MSRVHWLVFTACSALATGVFAEELREGSSKFSLNDTVLIYDTETAEAGEIEVEDVDVLLDILRHNEAIETLELNSSGGHVWAGREMARIVVDFDLDTVVHGECSSSCVRIFLGGNKRQMTLGSKIGFHQPYWRASSIENYYEQWHRKENWETPFEFAEWIFEDTQREYHEDLEYMLKRGVSAAFAIQSKGIASDDMWHPSRAELLRSGVLR